jgi:hypothetical protein
MAIVLSKSQLLALKADIAAQTDPVFVIERERRGTAAMAEWYNAKTASFGWRADVVRADYDDEPDYALFDTMSAGKRESWRLFIEAPRDFGRTKTRKWITDLWGAATANSASEGVLLAGTRKATRAEVLLAGASATTGTVTALRLQFAGSIGNDDVVAALAA